MKIYPTNLNDYQVVITKFELEVLQKALSLHDHQIKSISWTNDEWYALMRMMTELKFTLTPHA